MACRQPLGQPGAVLWSGLGQWMIWTKSCRAGSQSSTERRCYLLTTQALMSSWVSAPEITLCQSCDPTRIYEEGGCLSHIAALHACEHQTCVCAPRPILATCFLV